MSAKHQHDKRCYPFRDIAYWDSIDCYVQAQWNKKMARLLAKEPKSMKGFTFMPKGKVT